MSAPFMQLYVADYLGDINFDHGQTMSCGRNEALWFGNGGVLECRPQREERDCNERSLLRRYGAGVKILTMFREETYTDYREEWVEEAAAMVSGCGTLRAAVNTVARRPRSRAQCARATWA